MSTFVLGLMLACCQEAAEADPFAHVINLLYNPHFLPASELLPDSYAGPPPAAAEAHLPPGWFPDRGTRAALDEKVFTTPPRSVRIEAGPGARAVASYPLAIEQATFVIARARVMAEGNPEGARLALRWHMADGAMRRSASEPPAKERDFVQLLVSARPPEGARAVALVLEASGPLQACRFDDPILAMVSSDIAVATFPAGCHPRGVREAILKTRFPLAQPFARVTWGDQGKSLDVYPLQAHASGFIFYAVDLALFDALGQYAIEVRDAGIEGRVGRGRVAFLADPYAQLNAKAAAYVLARFSPSRAQDDALRTAAENAVLLSYTSAAPARQRLADVAVVLAARARDAKNLGIDEAAYSAWALARAGQALNDAGLAARARSLLHDACKGDAWHGTAARAALCGAASMLSARDNDPLDRDYADDTASELVASQGPDAAFPFPADVLELHWPVFALADFVRVCPSSTVVPKAQAALDAYVGRVERLCVSTPFGNARGVEAGACEVDIPAWKHGNTLYLLSQAASMCAHATPDSADRLRIHVERQVQFLLGFNPLGKALDLERCESLRRSAGELLRPGEVVFASAVDPLRAHLYLWYETECLRDGLTNAERLWQEYERARKEKQAKRK